MLLKILQGKHWDGKRFYLAGEVMEVPENSKLPERFPLRFRRMVPATVTEKQGYEKAEVQGESLVLKESVDQAPLEDEPPVSVSEGGDATYQDVLEALHPGEKTIIGGAYGKVFVARLDDERFRFKYTKDGESKTATRKSLKTAIRLLERIGAE